MSKLRTHYDNLKVARDAPDAVIRAAYKALMQKHHPDKYDGDPKEAERIVKVIQTSFAILSDPEKRAEHDKWIKAQEENIKQQEKPDFNAADENEEQQPHNKFDYRNCTEEDFYGIATREILSGNVKQGIMGQAIVETNGNETKLAASYISLRVRDLSEEIECAYISELTGIGCKVTTTQPKLWSSKKWKVIAQNGKSFNISALNELGSIIDQCKQIKQETLRERSIIEELTKLGCNVGIVISGSDKIWSIKTAFGMFTIQSIDELSGFIDRCKTENEKAATKKAASQSITDSEAILAFAKLLVTLSIVVAGMLYLSGAFT